MTLYATQRGTITGCIHSALIVALVERKRVTLPMPTPARATLVKGSVQ